MIKPAFKDLMIFIACTGIGEENGIEPFSEYLDQGRELTPYLRRWLIAMLQQDKTQTHHLLYRRHVGHPKPITNSPTVSEDAVVISKCSCRGTIEPFIEWLEAGCELTPPIRAWLVSILRREKSSRYILQYRAHGRQPSFARVMSDSEIDGRYFDLCGTMITDDLRHDLLVDTLHFSEAPMEEKGIKRIYRFGIRVRDASGDSYIHPVLRFEVGKRLKNGQIHHLLAAEFDTSISTVKRTLSARNAIRTIK